MSDKILHFLCGGGLFLSISFSLDLFGGPDIEYREAVAPAYFMVLGIAAMKELVDEADDEKRNDAKEHALDIASTMLGAAVAHVGVSFVRGIAR